MSGEGMTMRSDRTMNRTLSSLILGSALLLAALVAPVVVSAAGPCVPLAGTVTQDLFAETGTLALPGSTSVNVWGYATTSGGSPTLPGPTITATVGDTVTVNLTNHLPETTAIEFAGIDMAPDLVGVASGASTSYTFCATRPGTYLYEAGLLPGTSHQVAMGLYGALIVRPAGAPGQAYMSASTAFDSEAIVVLGEIDPALNGSATPAAFDMRDFAPKYQLINGAAYPNTTPIPTTVGSRVLLRYLNAGIQFHSMATLGVSQKVIAGDGSPLTYPRSMVAETLAPGATADVLVTMPSAAGRYPVYDANAFLNNNGTAGAGGMLVVLEAGTATPPLGGPVIDLTTIGPNPATGAVGPAPGGDVTMSATITGSAPITNAEYRIDSTGATPVALTGTFGSTNVTATGTIPQATVAGLASGSHTIYARASSDGGATWGAFDLITLTVDHDGPIVSALSLSPNPSNGTVTVALGGTASDAAAGGSTVTDWEYSIDGGTPVSSTIVTPATVVSLSATIPSGLGNGNPTVAVRARDALGNWGAPTTITLTVDSVGPVTSGVSANPNPTNGLIGINSSLPVVRVVGTFTDAVSNVANAEMFIDIVGANGSGILFYPSDGLFNSPTETGYGDIPLTTVRSLSQGIHTLYVHGKDSAGNWGTAISYALNVDKLAPTVSSLAATPNPTNTIVAPFSNNTSFTLSANADGTGSNVIAAEWFDGADPGIGNGQPFALVPAPTVSLTANIDFVGLGWAPGNHVISVRVKDGALNWSSTSSVTVSVVLPNLIFASGFDNAVSPFGWASVGGTSSQLTVSGSHLVAAISAGTSGYVQDNTPMADGTYLVRFTVDPNGLTYSNTSNATTPRTIFSALTSTGGTVFEIQLRRSSNSPTGVYQIRARVARAGGGGGFTNTNYCAVTSGVDTPVQVDWTSATSASFTLRVNGTICGSALSGLNTSAFKVETARLGPQGPLGTTSGSIRLDSFVSARRSLVGL